MPQDANDLLGLQTPQSLTTCSILGRRAKGCQVWRGPEAGRGTGALWRQLLSFCLCCPEEFSSIFNPAHQPSKLEPASVRPSPTLQKALWQPGVNSTHLSSPPTICYSCSLCFPPREVLEIKHSPPLYISSRCQHSVEDDVRATTIGPIFDSALRIATVGPFRMFTVGRKKKMSTVGIWKNHAI